MKRLPAILLLLAAAGVAASFCVVILDEREQAFRSFLQQADYERFGIRLNEPSLTEPGWYLRIPVLHDLRRYEKRLQRYDADPRDLFTSEKLQIKVDYFAMWRIEEPRRFFQSLKTVGGALQRLDNTLYSKVRDTLGKHPLSALLSPERTAIMRTIAEECDGELRDRGIRVVDVRIRRTQYQPENLAQVYGRMRSERQAAAKKHRAEGEERARTIRAEADLESQIELANARRESSRIRGEGDALAAKVYAEAYGQDEEFYAFARSLEAYRQAFDAETTLVLSPSSPFLKYLFGDGAAGPPTR